ncbi:MAG: hypothetical protein ACE5IQ_10295 [Candidatus Methylomirabilales bacterium]
MRKSWLVGLFTMIVLGASGVGLAGEAYTWGQVVERGMPDFNNQTVAQNALLATVPLHLSFSSGVHVVFVFVNHAGQTYGVYLDYDTDDVVGITRLDRDPSWPQGLHFYELYVDTGLLKGRALTGRFLHIAGNNPVFAGVCQIADLSNEARRHAACPGSA